jgi:hypothetical protein
LHKNTLVAVVFTPCAFDPLMHAPFNPDSFMHMLGIISAELEIQEEQSRASTVVHKHQVAMILIFLWIKASPGAFNHAYCPLF